jgi:hypothetical protein
MKINVTPEEFADIVVLFLLDQMIKNPLDGRNEAFDALLGNLKGKGVRPILTKYFLATPRSTKVLYKYIRGVFEEGDTSTQVIQIKNRASVAAKDDEPEDDGLIKKAIRKAVNLLRPGTPIKNEEKFEEFVQKVLNEVLAEEQNTKE